jgi:hypothetical protein
MTVEVRTQTPKPSVSAAEFTRNDTTYGFPYKAE